MPKYKFQVNWSISASSNLPEAAFFPHCVLPNINTTQSRSSRNWIAEEFFYEKTLDFVSRGSSFPWMYLFQCTSDEMQVKQICIAGLKIGSCKFLPWGMPWATTLGQTNHGNCPSTISRPPGAPHPTPELGGRCSRCQFCNFLSKMLTDTIFC